MQSMSIFDSSPPAVAIATTGGRRLRVIPGQWRRIIRRRTEAFKQKRGRFYHPLSPAWYARVAK